MPVLQIRIQHITFAMILKFTIMQKESETVTIPEFISIDFIQKMCQYENLDSMRSAWKYTHKGIKFPKRRDFIPKEILIAYLQTLAMDRPGKQKSVIDGALKITELIYANPGILKSEPETGLSTKANRTGTDTFLPGGPNIVFEKPKPNRNPKPRPLPPVQNPEPLPVRPEPMPEPDVIVSETNSEQHTWIIKKIIRGSEIVASWTGFVWITILTCAATAYGCIIYFDWIGALVSAVYMLVIFEAVRIANKQNGGATERTLAVLAVIAIEVLAGFIHFAWINLLMWAKVDKLPFHWQSIERIRIGGQWTEQILNTTPGIIAVVFSVFLSCASVYSVAQQINRTIAKFWD